MMLGWPAAYLLVGWALMELTRVDQRRRRRPRMRTGEVLWIVFGWPIIATGAIWKIARGG